MQVNTKANLISYYDDSFVGRDGQPVAAYKVQVGNSGEAAVEFPLDEEVYNQLVSNKVGYTENVPLVLDLRKYGNKLSVRCVKVG